MHAYYAQEERCIMIVLWWYDEAYWEKKNPCFTMETVMQYVDFSTQIIMT